MDETDGQTTKWQRMTTQERTAFLKPAIEHGWTIRLSYTHEVQQGRETFGPDYPVEWYRGTIKDLRRSVPGRGRAVGSGPGMYVYAPVVYGPGAMLPGTFGMERKGQQVAWDDLYDVEVIEPKAPPEPEPARRKAGEPLRCPYCGEALSIQITSAEGIAITRGEE